jgi:hypothetical protein
MATFNFIKQISLIYKIEKTPVFSTPETRLISWAYSLPAKTVSGGELAMNEL